MKLSDDLDNLIAAKMVKQVPVKMTFNASPEAASIVAEYLEYHEQTKGNKITVDVLLSSLIESSLVRQKSFRQWRTGRKEQSQ
jgi:hypothetical protein